MGVLPSWTVHPGADPIQKPTDHPSCNANKKATLATGSERRRLLALRKNASLALAPAKGWRTDQGWTPPRGRRAGANAHVSAFNRRSLGSNVRPM